MISLAVKAYNRYYGDRDEAIAAGEKFLQTASMLAEGDYLGFQLSPRRQDRLRCDCLSGVDVSITQEDYAWIFHDCADVALVSNDAHDDTFSENRRVYILVLRESSGEAGDHPSGAKSIRLAEEYFTQLLGMMVGPSAAIRIIAEPVCGS